MILVIGATGKVGSELVKALDRAGVPVRALTRYPEKAEKINLPHVEIVRGDLSRPADLKPLFEDIDRLFQVSSPGKDQIAEQNAVLKLARKAKVRLIVRMTAAGVATDSPSQILRWHAENERKIQKSGIPWVILRPNFFFQNFLGFAPSIRDQRAFYAPFGEGRASQIDVRDIAQVALKVLTGEGHAGNTYELTGAESVTAARVAEVMSRALGREIRYVPVTPEASVAAMIRAGVPEWVAADVTRIYAYWAESLNDHVYDTVEKITGKPPRDFESFVKECAAAFGG